MSAVASLGLPGRSLRTARIIAIPLARPKALNGDSGKVLTYYQFRLSKAGQEPSSVVPQEGHGAEGKRKGWLPEEGVATWAQNKASGLWASFGKAEGGWKLKTFQLGERLMDRVEFEELALKSLDPSMGPTIGHPTKNDIAEKDEEGRDVGPLKIPLLFPSTITNTESVLAQLQRDTNHRTPTHRKGFLMWAAICPFLLPIAIVPLVPNLPLFFAMWRSWSHYRAFKSSQYLQSLLDKGVIVPEPSPILDALYKEHPTASPFASQPPPSESTPLNDAATRPELLLAKTAVPDVVERFELDESVRGDLYRAVEQVRVRVASGKA